MNKLIGAIALAGILCIASAATQSSGGANAADPIPTDSIVFSIGSSPECPNFSNGSLMLQTNPGYGVSECLIASLESGYSANQLHFSSTNLQNNIFSASVDSVTVTLGNSPSILNLSELSASAKIDFSANSQASASTGGTVTITVSGYLSPITDFEYSGEPDTFTAPASGLYQLEVWGAQGGSTLVNQYIGGKGGYSKGEINLTAGDNLYVYVGGQGIGATASRQHEIFPGGWNGGGAGGLGGATANTSGGSGGGGTDIRFNTTSALTGTAGSDPRIIVAGGGGGAWGRGGYASQFAHMHGGYGGGLAGQNRADANSAGSFYAFGGTQDTGYSVAGVGQDAATRNGGTQEGQGGAGGGWWGGRRTSDSAFISGAGGSGYVGGVTNSIIYAGNVSFYSPTGTYEEGHVGPGHARITYCGTICT